MKLTKVLSSLIILVLLITGGTLMSEAKTMIGIKFSLKVRMLM